MNSKFYNKMLFYFISFLLIISQAISQDRIFKLVDKVKDSIADSAGKMFDEMNRTSQMIQQHFRPDKIYNTMSEAFQNLKVKYGKTYPTPEELNKRLETFIKSCQAVFQQNLLRQSGLASYDTEINQFYDMNRQEVLEKHSGLKLNKAFKSRRSLNQTYSFSRKTRGTDNIPDKWDWRDFNILAPVKNQGSCGSCWAFTANCALESHLMKAQLCQNKSMSDINLSEQNLIDCSQSYGNQGCDGGLMVDAYKYTKDNGVMAGSDYPFLESNGEQCQYKSDKKVGSCVGYKEVQPYDEEAVKRALYMKGPLSCAVYVTDDFIRYRSGVFDDSTCPEDRNEISHAVCIVGYGKTDDNIEYWIVRNSWGKSWGENGYFRIKRKNTCNIASYCSYPIVDNCIDTDKSWMANNKKLKSIQIGSSSCICK